MRELEIINDLLVDVEHEHDWEYIDSYRDSEDSVYIERCAECKSFKLFWSSVISHESDVSIITKESDLKKYERLEDSYNFNRTR